jgi:hypothetical protein
MWKASVNVPFVFEEGSRGDTGEMMNESQKRSLPHHPLDPVAP